MKILLFLFTFLLNVPVFAEDNQGFLRALLESPDVVKRTIPAKTAQEIFNRLQPGEQYIESRSSNGITIKRYIGVEIVNGQKMIVSRVETSSDPLPPHPPVIINGEFHGELNVSNDSSTNNSTNKNSSPPSRAESNTNTPPPSSPSEYNWNRTAGEAIHTGISAGLLKGLEVGILIPPSEKREWDHIQEEFNKARISSNASRAALLEELAAYDRMTDSYFQSTLHDWENYQPLQKTTEALNNPIIKRLQVVYQKMHSLHPNSAQQSSYKEAAIKSSQAAERQLQQGEQDTAEKITVMAELFSDIALGINPITSISKDGVEFLTGHHALTNRELSGLERGLAGASFAAGLATMGFASSLIDGVQIAVKISIVNGPHIATAFRHFQETITLTRTLGIHSAQGVADFIHAAKAEIKLTAGSITSVTHLKESLKLGKWAKSYDIYRIHEANKLNANILAKNAMYKPPYKPNSQVYDILTKEKESYIRLYSRRVEFVKGVPTEINNIEGSWIVRKEAIDKFLTPAQLKDKYSLPYPPNAIAEVEVSAGTLLRRSKANSLFGGGEGAIQYEILDNINNGSVKFTHLRDLTP